VRRMHSGPLLRCIKTKKMQIGGRGKKNGSVGKGRHMPRSSSPRSGRRGGMVQIMGEETNLHGRNIMIDSARYTKRLDRGEGKKDSTRLTAAPPLGFMKRAWKLRETELTGRPTAEEKKIRLSQVFKMSPFKVIGI